MKTILLSVVLFSLPLVAPAQDINYYEITGNVMRMEVQEDGVTHAVKKATLTIRTDDRATDQRVIVECDTVFSGVRDLCSNPSVWMTCHHVALVSTCVGTTCDTIRQWSCLKLPSNQGACALGWGHLRPSKSIGVGTMPYIEALYQGSNCSPH
jgi:hypothetical protein